jgi:hypothetical protein
MALEVIVDRAVVARAMRGEGRRPLDHLAEPMERVRLRFLFDDPNHPDFDMDLWVVADVGHHGRLDPDEALAEANRWTARIEALLRRPLSPRPAAAPAVMAASAAGPLFDRDADDDAFEDENAIT